MKNLNKNKLAVIYCRTNSYVEDIKRQERICRNAIKKDGAELVEIIIDTRKNGRNFNRAGIKELFKLIEEKKINIIYTTNINRITRNSLDYFNLEDLCNKNNISFRCVEQNIIDDSATSKLMMSLEVILSEATYLRANELRKL